MDYLIRPTLLLMVFSLVPLCTHASYRESSRQTIKTIACQYLPLTLHCPAEHVIRIERANYGRFSPRVCNPQGFVNLNVNCRSNGSAEIISTRCDGREKCEFLVSSRLFGDSCPGTSKYAEVHHYCEPKDTQTKIPDPLPDGPILPERFTVPVPEGIRVCQHPMSMGSVYDLSWHMPTPTPNIIHFGLRYRVAGETGERDIQRNELVDGLYTAMFLPKEEQRSLHHEFAIRAFSLQHGWGSYSDFVSPQFCTGDGPLTSTTTMSSSLYPKDGGGLRQACREQKKLGVHWPETGPNEVRSALCPNYLGEGVMHYKCLSTGIWDPNGPETGDCVKRVATTTTTSTTTVTSTAATTTTSVTTTSTESHTTKIVDYPSAVDNIVRNLTGSKNDKYDLGRILPTLVHDLTENVEKTQSVREKKVLADHYKESIVAMTDELLKDGRAWNNMSETRQRSTAASLLSSVEDIGLLAASTLSVGSSNTTFTSNVVMKVLNVNIAKNENVTLDSKAPTGKISKFNQFTIPSSVLRQFLEKNKASVPVVFVVLSNMSEWLAPEPNTNINNIVIEDRPPKDPPRRIVNSDIMSVSLSERPVKNLVEPVTFLMEHRQMESVANPKCSFWDMDISAWSSEGCRVASTNKTHTVCKCNHLTSFAVLMDITGATLVIPAKVRFSLELLTYIGCTISIVCLLLSWITFVSFKNLSCDRNTIHKHLVFCLMVAQIVLVLGIQRTSLPVLCSVIAGVLHYFFLASFAWMCLEGVQLYVMLIEVFESERSRVLYYYLFGYGVPAVIVGISAAVFSGGYGTEFHCWLSIERGFIWSFVGPALAVMLINVIMLGIAIYTMVRHSGMSHTMRQKSLLQKTRTWVKGAVVLVVLLGLTWVFGVLYLDNSYHTIIFSYIFTILNTLQGLFIFLFHCLFNEKVRKEYRRLLRHSSWLPDCLRARYGKGSSSGSRENSSGNVMTRFLRGKKQNNAGDSSVNSAKPFLHKEQRAYSSSAPSSSDGVISSRLSSDNSNNNNRKASQTSSLHANTDPRFLRPMEMNGISGELSEVLDCSVVDSEFVSEYCQQNLQVKSEEKRYSTASEDSEEGNELKARSGDGIEDSVDDLAALSVESMSKQGIRPVSHCDLSEGENKDEGWDDSDDGDEDDAASSPARFANPAYCPPQGGEDKGNPDNKEGAEEEGGMDPEHQPLMMKETDSECVSNKSQEAERQQTNSKQSPSLNHINHADTEDKGSKPAHTSVPCLKFKPSAPPTSGTGTEMEKDTVMNSLPNLSHTHTNGLASLPDQNSAGRTAPVKRHSSDGHMQLSHSRVSSSDC